MIARVIAALLAVLTPACGDDDPAGETARAALCDAVAGLCEGPSVAVPTLSAPTQVAPSSALPSQVVSQDAHNNLDVAFHQDRLFFAFRLLRRAGRGGGHPCRAIRRRGHS